MIVVLLYLWGCFHIDCNWEIKSSFCCIISMSDFVCDEGRAPTGEDVD